MPVLSIAESGAGQAVVTFAGGKWTVDIAPPFDDVQERELRWYFEVRLQFPMLGKERAAAAAASVRTYGERIFSQVFRDPRLLAEYLRAGVDGLLIEISGSPEFHRLHWEALWDPAQPEPLARRAVMVRREFVQGGAAFGQPESPVLRVLVVVARPGGRADVGYRTISRPLVELLRQSRLPVELEFVRPGTFTQLQQQLSQRAQGYYHVLHFDGHGKVITASDVKRMKAAGGYLFDAEVPVSAGNQEKRAHLFFESDSGEAHAIDAATLAKAVNGAQVPVVILNACQSGQEHGDAESNLASRLAREGVRGVLGMSYSVTVSAAKIFIERLYRAVFDGQPMAAGVTRGRAELLLHKARRGHFGLSVDLEDWILPVYYESAPVALSVRATYAEETALLLRQGQIAAPPPVFWGRDLDILEIERRLARHGNILLIEGMGGAGKSTLLQHLAWWWQSTGWAERVFTFAFDQKPWTRQQIVHKIAEELELPIDSVIEQRVVKRLRAEPHLLVLDNFESVTGEELAIGQALPEAERVALRELIVSLRGGKTRVLLGSRDKEAWLAAGTFDQNVHALRGLDPEATTSYADQILQRCEVDLAVRETDEYKRLLQLLGGHPLAMQVVLPNLKSQTAEAVVRALEAGDARLDAKGGGRTESILKCVDYSFAYLSADAQELLTCFALFTHVISADFVPEFVDELRQEPELAGLPFDQVGEVLGRAERWGLLRTEGAFLELQPVFPFFLRARLNGERKAAVERAFRRHYDGLCGAIGDLQTSKDAPEKQAGHTMGEREYENAYTALRLGLAARGSILKPYAMLSRQIDARQDQVTGLALAESVLADLRDYPEAVLAGPVGLELVGAVDNAAKRMMLAKRHPQAGRLYEEALRILQASQALDEPARRRMSASIYHQLGRVAEEQRQWVEAEGHYREALGITVEFNDRYSQARTYHQLGIVAQKQGQWAEAAGHYGEALRICVEFQDGHRRDMVLRSLSRLQRESGGDSVFALVAEVLGVPVDEARRLLAAADGPAPVEPSVA